MLHDPISVKISKHDETGSDKVSTPNWKHSAPLSPGTGTKREKVPPLSNIGLSFKRRSLPPMTETGFPPIQVGDVDLRTLIRFSMSNKALEFALYTFPISTSSEIEFYSPTDAESPVVPTPPPPREPDVPFFREVVKGVLFSRHFIKTYNLVLLICLLGTTAIYQIDRLLARRRQRKALPLSSSALRVQRLAHGDSAESLAATTVSPPESSEPGGSSGSSTPLNDERKPLISRGHQYTIGRKLLSLRSIYNRISGVVSYQPAHFFRYECPPISTCILIASYYALNIFYASYKVPFESLKMFIFADRLGLVFVMNLPLLYLIAAKNCPLKILTGWSYEQLNIIHRAVGRVCIVAGIGHFAAFVWVWDKALSKLSFQEFIFSPVIFLGLLAFISYFLIGITSKEEFRNSFYELFLFTHILFQILALGFLYFHYHTSRPYILACIFIFIVDRIIFRLYVRSVWTTGKVAVLEDKKTVRVTIDNCASKTWDAGDHVFLSIPSVAYLHPHPFSIVSPPPPHSSKMEFLIRARDGFSKKLLELATKPMISGAILNLVIDGPYGSSFATQCLRSSDAALLIAGGSGIAVIYPLTHKLATESQGSRPRDEEHGVQREDMPKRIVIVWIVHKSSHLSWLQGGEQDLLELERLGVQVLVHVTKTEGKRPEIEKVIGDVVGVDGCELGADSLGVVVCGPSGMVRDTRNSSARLMRRGLDIRVIAEKFGW